jgi:thioesterase domain-containing protein
MDEMIVDYLAALRELQPVGPYHLCGWSTGGIFAFAIAEALDQAGDEVALLALFDTPLPSICDGVDVENDARFLCNLMNYATRFSGADVNLSYEELAKLAPDERFGAALDLARERGIIPAETPESFIRRLVDVGKGNVVSIQGYQPRPLNTTALMFVPSIKGGLADVSGKQVSTQPDNGWTSELQQAVTLIEVPGDHFTMMLGNSAATLAAELSHRLALPSRAGRSIQPPIFSTD